MASTSNQVDACLFLRTLSKGPEEGPSEVQYASGRNPLCQCGVCCAGWSRRQFVQDTELTVLLDGAGNVQGGECGRAGGAGCAAARADGMQPGQLQPGGLLPEPARPPLGGPAAISRRPPCLLQEGLPEKWVLFSMVSSPEEWVFFSVLLLGIQQLFPIIKVSDWSSGVVVNQVRQSRQQPGRGWCRLRPTGWGWFGPCWGGWPRCPRQSSSAASLGSPLGRCVNMVMALYAQCLQCNCCRACGGLRKVLSVPFFSSQVCGTSRRFCTMPR